MEKGAGVLGDIYRYESMYHISDPDNPISKMYSRIWKAKRDILLAKTEEELNRIEGQFDLAAGLLSDLGV